MYDVAIIGAGVTGAAIARTLSAYNIRVVMLEAQDDIAMGASRANSAIVHAGYDCQPGTLMAELNVKGNAMMQGVCADLSVPYKNIGTYVVGFSDEDTATLQQLLERGRENGVPGLNIISGERMREIEPCISEEVVSALHAPTGSITCPYELTIAYAENAVRNGVELKLNWRLEGMERTQGHFVLKSTDGQLVQTRFVVNAAGVYADVVNDMAGGEHFTIVPRKGQYMLLDRQVGEMVRNVIFQTPSKMGKGVLVAPTVDENVFAGPTAEDITDKEDTSTTAEGMAQLRQSACLSVPKLALNKVITSFCGLRAQVAEKHDFIIREEPGVPGFVNAAGICSPGLSSAPAIGERVAEILADAGLNMPANANFDPKREKPKKFREMTHEERAAAVERDRHYARVVCRCETVTEAEILHAVRSPIPARSIDAVKRRTRAGMGRCQGGFCSPRVMEIISAELGIPMVEITKNGGSSYMLTGVLKQGSEGR